jgi:HK97 family phage major capsid protein
MEELFAIEASDTVEVKQVKEKLNTVYKKSSENTTKMSSELKEAFKLEVAGIINQNTEFKSQLEAIVAQKAEIDQKLQDQQEALLELNRFKSSAQEREAKGVSFGDALSKGIDDNIDAIKKFAEKKSSTPVQFELKAVGDMGLSSITGLTAANVQMAPGIVPYPNRLVHMRDLIPTGRMSTSLYNFLKEIGFDGSISTWQENSGAKPQFDIRYQEVSAPSQFIAGYIKISRKSLDDIPALKASLANRLLQKYLDAEDTQILSGNGANGQLSGIYQSGNSIAYVPGRTKSIEMVVDSQSIIEELNHNVTGMLFRPRGYNDLMLSQSAGSTTGIYSLPGMGTVAMINGQLTVNGAPAYKTTAMVDNSFLIGDFEKALMLLLREDPIVEFFEQDGDNVKNNQITVRVEGRVALPIFYNDALIHGTFVNPGS